MTTERSLPSFLYRRRIGRSKDDDVVRNDDGSWRRDDESHENLLVDTSQVPGLLAEHGVDATPRQILRFGASARRTARDHRAEDTAVTQPFGVGYVRCEVGLERTPLEFGGAQTACGRQSTAPPSMLISMPRTISGAHDRRRVLMDWIPIDPAAVAPPPGEWFSHAAKIELAGTNLLFVSGQVAVDIKGNLVGKGDLGAQTEQVFANLHQILADQGATFEDIVNIRTFVTDLSRISEYGAVRARYLSGSKPTSTTVQVGRLVNPDALVEIDVVAVISNKGNDARAEAGS